MKNAISALTLVYALFLTNCSSRITDEPVREPNYFPAAEVCIYPQGAPAKTFAKLGGGTWAAGAAGSYQCDGARSNVQLYNADGLAIDVNYEVTGVEKGASMISLDYNVTGDKPVPNENTYRGVFANLIDAITKQGLKGPTSELFRKKLMNLNSYYESGKGSPETFDIGTGFVTLNREATADKLNISITVKFYPDTSFKLDK